MTLLGFWQQVSVQQLLQSLLSAGIIFWAAAVSHKPVHNSPQVVVGLCQQRVVTTKGGVHIEGCQDALMDWHCYISLKGLHAPLVGKSVAGPTPCCWRPSHALQDALLLCGLTLAELRGQPADAQAGTRVVR